MSGVEKQFCDGLPRVLKPLRRRNKQNVTSIKGIRTNFSFRVHSRDASNFVYQRELVCHCELCLLDEWKPNDCKRKGVCGNWRKVALQKQAGQAGAKRSGRSARTRLGCQTAARRLQQK